MTPCTFYPINTCFKFGAGTYLLPQIGSAQPPPPPCVNQVYPPPCVRSKQPHFPFCPTLFTPGTESFML